MYIYVYTRVDQCISMHGGVNFNDMCTVVAYLLLLESVFSRVFIPGWLHCLGIPRGRLFNDVTLVLFSY